MSRSPGLSIWLAGLLMLSWLALLIEGFWNRFLASDLSKTVSRTTLLLSLQTLHQETLFFCIPFFLAATVWGSLHLGFLVLILVLALVSIIDPLYQRWIAHRRSSWIAMHAITVLLAMLICLPFIFKINASESLGLAILIAATISLPSFWLSISIKGIRKAIFLSGLVFVMAGAMWLGKSAIPSPAILMDKGAVVHSLPEKGITVIGKGFIEANEISRGLYTFTRIQAPGGLSQKISHDWYQEGKLIDSIPLSITGNGELGYRTWTHKQNFPENPTGNWRVDIRSEQGQLLGRVKFTVLGRS